MTVEKAVLLGYTNERGGQRGFVRRRNDGSECKWDCCENTSVTSEKSFK